MIVLDQIRGFFTQPSVMEEASARSCCATHFHQSHHRRFHADHSSQSNCAIHQRQAAKVNLRRGATHEVCHDAAAAAGLRPAV